MMWLEAILSSILVLTAVILYFQVPQEQNNLMDFYSYLFLSDQAFLYINSNLSLFCEPPSNPNLCLKCVTYLLNDSLAKKEVFSSDECQLSYQESKNKQITLNQIFYQDQQLKKLSLTLFYK